MLPRVERPKTWNVVGVIGGLTLAAAATLLGASGCGQSVSGYCYDAAQCEGSNDYDEEACNLYVGRVQDLADIQNCSSEFADYFDCITQQSRCKDDRYSDEDACRSQYEQLDNCADLENEVFN